MISAMREQYMRNGEGFLLVYSITSRMSFEEITTFYQQICRVKDRDYFPMVLVANKSDLESDRQVSTQGITKKCQQGGKRSVLTFFDCLLICIEGRDLAKEFGCQFIETSAKQRINVDEAFHDVVRDIRKYNKEQETRGNHDQFGVQDAPDAAADKCCVLM
jgi:GTPase KRas protein